MDDKGGIQMPATWDDGTFAVGTAMAIRRKGQDGGKNTGWQTENLAEGAGRAEGKRTGRVCSRGKQSLYFPVNQYCGEV